MPTRAGFTNRKAIFICGALLCLFAAVAWFAAESKSPAYDEPYHALSSWLQLRHLDFRFDNEDPPLWQYWASLPNSKSALTADFDDPIWKAMPQQLVHQWYWGVQTLYRTAGNNPVQLIARCRAMMLSVAVLLGFLICYWAWRIGGPIAAVVAGILFCLDPNFLAHSPLMKNDVAFAMSMFGLALALWRAGQKLDLEAFGWIALLCIVTLTVKFSGLVAVVLVPVLLGLRAMMPHAWPVFGRTISTRFGRLLIAASVTILMAAISYAGIWAVYGFRFGPTPDTGVSLNMTELSEQVKKNQAAIQRYRGQPADAAASNQLSLAARAALFANDHRLLPQAFIAGFLFTYCNAIVRVSYLCGQISPEGWWWYFPFAILVKTPIATLLAAGATARVAFGALRQGRLRDSSRQWTILCLGIPVILFLGSAMAAKLNIGIRHVLSIYPFVFVAIGCTAASVWKTGRAKTKYGIVALGLALAIESLSTFPNFIPYFNVVAANMPGGKLALLGDSNLDWGQDLLLLAQWQRAHPNDMLYLSYFGYADPMYYGIKYTSLPGGYYYDAHRQWVDPFSRSVVAISASNLQGILVKDELKDYYAHWRTRKPMAVLGDSIYLFENDPMKNLRINAEVRSQNAE
jgi:hypothetical protein